MNLQQLKAVIFGHAIGDALGVPVEFKSREELTNKPVTGMTGFGTYPVPAGAWSDDTSMSLCALESLSSGVLDYEDIMKNFDSWYYNDAFTPTGKLFDVGNTCRDSIENHAIFNKPFDLCGQTEEYSNGNGSLMRIHPIALYLADKKIYIEEKFNAILLASALTHAHKRSKTGCVIYSCVLWELLQNPCKESVVSGLANAKKYFGEVSEFAAYHRIYGENFFELPSDEIKSSGYIVDTLEAALWCLMTTDSFSACVLKAVNLGSDTDTVAAVAGGLAGALYGLSEIPAEWLETLIKREYIDDMCERAFKAWTE